MEPAKLTSSMLPNVRSRVLGKIAIELNEAVARRERREERGATYRSALAQGEGWSVADVLCTFGPGDRAFEEQYSGVTIAMVLAGTFQCRSPRGHSLMSPGSCLLGNYGECFECGHEHASGDRCVSFRFAPDYFCRVAADAGVPPGARMFRTSRLPPARESAHLVARALAALSSYGAASWEALAIDVASSIARLAAGLPEAHVAISSKALARVTGGVRAIENNPGAGWTLKALAAEARLSPFNYLRAFQRATGTTPHQFIIRSRLRTAAMRLAGEETTVTRIALDSGFGDISNFNHAFRREYGATPGMFRGTHQRDRSEARRA